MANLHHKDLNPDHYKDLEDESHFVMLNKQTHEAVHWLWRYYEKDPEIITRLEKLLNEMKEINKGV